MSRTVHHYPDRYAQLMHIARTAVPGTLLATAMAELSLTSTIAVTSLLKRLRAAGYDMSAWDRAARPSVSAGRGQGISGQKQTAANAPEHVRARRDQWYADAREVSGKLGAIGLLCEKWNLQLPTTSARRLALAAAVAELLDELRDLCLQAPDVCLTGGVQLPHGLELGLQLRQAGLEFDDLDDGIRHGTRHTTAAHRAHEVNEFWRHWSPDEQEDGRSKPDDQSHDGRGSTGDDAILHDRDGLPGLSAVAVVMGCKVHSLLHGH